MSINFYEILLSKNEFINAGDAAGLGDKRLSTPYRDQKARDQRTVFYVDENPKSLRLLTFVLEGCGYKVITAKSFSNALIEMEHTSYDLVLLSYRRPQMVVCQLAREIKQLKPRIPIVLISGFTHLADEELTYVDAHVGKARLWKTY